MNLGRKLLVLSLMTSPLVISRCENKERYYRPDFPKQICSIGIIDIDDTTIYDGGSSVNAHLLSHAREISFEKSFQSEYLDELNDSLRKFSFSISDGKKDMFVYRGNQTDKNLLLDLPDSLKFESGKKYFFRAGEKEAQDISAECTVPVLPPELSLISINTGYTILNEADVASCMREPTYFTRRTAEIEFSFPNNNPDSYYAVLLTGSVSDMPVDGSPGYGSILLNYNVLETNAIGFFNPIQGRNTWEEYWELKSQRIYCNNGYRQATLNAYYIDGSKIPGGNCTLKISVQWDWIKFPPHFIKCFHIRLMSIPKEAYLFEKSLYTYSRVHNDPFSEPTNIKGNIKGGNGVIAICRSRELIVYTGQKGDRYDPYF